MLAVDFAGEFSVDARSDRADDERRAEGECTSLSWHANTRFKHALIYALVNQTAVCQTNMKQEYLLITNDVASEAQCLGTPTINIFVALSELRLL